MHSEILLNNKYSLHKNLSGELASSRLGDKVFYFIEKNINKSSNTLETGGGISTLLFALKSTNHICVTPNTEQVGRILEYCTQHRISTENLKFCVENSENILPSLELGELDLVLLDGRYAFPIPLIDWHYTSSKLKIGGIVIIGNTQIWTGAILNNFLLSEPEWRLQTSFASKTAVFVKTKQYSQRKHWIQQEYLLRNSSRLIRAANMRQAFKLLCRGEVSKAVAKVAEYLD